MPKELRLTHYQPHADVQVDDTVSKNADEKACGNQYGSNYGSESVPQLSTGYRGQRT